MLHVSHPMPPCSPAHPWPGLLGHELPMPQGMPWSESDAMPLHGRSVTIESAVDPDDDEEDLADEEDLTVAQPTADDESSFDDFDDEFDDDFEEEENDPDWDHPDDGDAEPPPGKAPGRKK